MIAGQTRQAPASAGVSSGHFARTYIKLHAKTGAGHHRGSKASHWERFGTRWVLGVSRTGIMLMEFQGVRGHPRAAPCEATARAVVSRLRDLPQDRGSTRTDVPDSCRVHSSTSHIRGLRHASKLLISKRSHIAPYVTQSYYRPVDPGCKCRQIGARRRALPRFPSDDPQSRHPDSPATAREVDASAPGLPDRCRCSLGWSLRSFAPGCGWSKERTRPRSTR